MSPPTASLPSWFTWEQRPFPDANLLLIDARVPALVDSGFVGHAEDTRAWSAAHASAPVALVVNTHWHCDHVGGNALLRAHGAEVVASSVDEEALARRARARRPRDARPAVAARLVSRGRRQTVGAAD